jgi:hypothetical protein
MGLKALAFHGSSAVSVCGLRDIGQSQTGFLINQVEIVNLEKRILAPLRSDECPMQRTSVKSVRSLVSLYVLYVTIKRFLS